MTRSIRGSRRAAVLLPGIAAAAGMLLLSGCGAGQISETANKVPSIQGVDLQAEDGRYGVRSVLIAYPGVEGYRAGDDAILNALFYNDSPDPVTVTVTSSDAREVVLTTVQAATSPSPTASPSPTGSPSPDQSPEGTPSPDDSPSPDETPSPEPTESPAGGPARIEIPPLSYVQLNTEGEQVLQLLGLNSALLAGQNITVTFDFGDGNTITSPAPVSVPLSPAPPPSPIIERHTGFDGH
ncbi:hypothetical protein [Micromonospora craniellae]|uniref:Copper chaperone PCu(A)C n=1 Tax=Micromonospora craniellae TaxID=2294034 RepID=A0A372FR67_9ACTN|nr:hypothetical protein [Micromonospora craniellae]QOC90000.1 hypothetical protein ID554_17445 [Micromonospora craniellae]RFS43277.1 hypothetical protein D0Q02_28690 [Micromonospora craniellae]